MDIEKALKKIQNKDYQSVELIFENCESFEIEKENISSFSIFEYVFSLSPYSKKPDIYFLDFFIEISPKGNKLEKLYPGFDDSPLPFKRVLSRSDITSVNVFFDEEDCLFFYLFWDDSSFKSSKNQKNYTRDNGNLVIENNANFFKI